jgi:hypothetical protein
MEVMKSTTPMPINAKINLQGIWKKVGKYVRDDPECTTFSALHEHLHTIHSF